MLQDGELSHPDLMRRSRRIHERALATAVGGLVGAVQAGELNLAPRASALFEACIPAIPYAAATAFLGREKLKLTRADGERPRVALVADGLGSTHGVTRTVAQIRDRGVPGYEVEVIGTDADVDRRLSSVAEIEIPFYAGMRIGVPGVPALVEALADGRYDLIHLVSPGPAGIGAWLMARVMQLPVIGSYHTELAAYAGLRSGSAHLELFATAALRGFYGPCEMVLSPSEATDARLAELGIDVRADRPLGPRGRPRPLRPGPAVTPSCSAASATSSTPAGSPRRRAPTCSPTRSSPPARGIPACTLCSPAAAPRSRCSASACVSTRRSWAGWRAPSSPAPTRAPMRSCSRVAPTPSARSSSRRRRAGCR